MNSAVQEDPKAARETKQGEDNSTEKSPQKNINIKDFTVIRSLGQGAYAEVKLVKKNSNGKQYALKIMDKKYMKKEEKQYQIFAEKDILSKLDHPGVVKLFFAFHDQRKVYFVLEYLAGGTLYDFLEAKGGKLESSVTKFFAAEMVLILEYLHKNRIVHRDFKPENLMLTENGHLKAIDFGTAKSFEEQTRKIDNMKEIGLSEAGNKEETKNRSSFVGTAQYVSPELLEDNVCNAPADLWALGCIIFLMATGKMAFEADSEYLIFQKIKQVKIQWPESIDPTARDLIDKLVCRAPEARLGGGIEGSANDYTALKAHPYFEGIDFKNLFESESPVLKLESLKKDDQQVKNLILTNEPKLKYFDEATQKPMEILINNSIKAEIVSDNEFEVIGPSHRITFKSLDHPAATWAKAINQLSLRSNNGS